MFLAFVAFAALVSMAHASSYYDTETGTYTEVQAAVAGTYSGGKVYSAAAYVYAIITTNLPSPFCLVVYWFFQWVDLNYTTHTSFSTTNYTGYTQAGQHVKISATGLPTQVINIYVEGRAGYDGVWDTPLASVGIPEN